MYSKNKFYKVLSLLFFVAVLLASVQPPTAVAQGSDGLLRKVNAESGKVSFLKPESGRLLSASRALGTFIRPQDPALALAKRYAPEFGIQNPERDLTEIKKNQTEDGRQSVRYQQNYQDIPVLGGELIVNTNERGDLYSINGEVSPDISLATQPQIDSAQATQTALQAVAKWYEKSTEDFVASEADLWIYDESLLQPSNRPVELVWRMEVTPKELGMPVRELVLVHAERGSISLHFNQIDTAWETHRDPVITMDLIPATTVSTFGISEPASRGNLPLLTVSPAMSLLSAPLVSTYTAGNTSTLPGAFLCDQTDPDCAAGDSYAKAAHRYAIGTYNLYAAQHQRDSIDNNGMVIISTVHYGVSYANAFWNGSQMVYGDAYGFPLADDVVAHELTHGVTQYESNLFYYYQSGAINEAFSDLWGEYYDQTNGLGGNDAPNVKWLIGEDVSGLGVLRSMNNPPAYSDPDKMSSPYYYEGEDDNGGVHANSGVNSKAVYLMVDGGTFNGRTVTALGWEKVGAIYYEVNTNLLISGSDYSDLYYALQQACNNLIGQHGITAGDCVEVKDALDAVEMNGQPATNFNTEAPVCDAGNPLSTVFFDNLEAGAGNYVPGAFVGSNRWSYDSPYGSYAHSGLHFLYADDYPAAATDTYLRTTSAIHIPSKAFLRFSHAFGFENNGATTYDGGILEYSNNNGASWQSAAGLFVNNGYNGAIVMNEGNPLMGRAAFVSDSHGYISSRLNLQSLANQNVMFRWRMGLDPAVVDWGWWLDDIHIYTCNAPTFGDVPVSHPYSSDIEILYANGYTGGCSTSPLLYCPDTIMNRAQAAVFMLRGNFGSSYVPVTPTHFFGDNWSGAAWAEGWAESMFLENLSGGCSVSPRLFCPEEQLTNVQAAVFGLRMKYGTNYAPPAASGAVFADLTDVSFWGTSWAEQAYAAGLIPACGTSGGKPLFCPNNLVSRGFGASIIVKAKGLTMPP